MLEPLRPITLPASPGLTTNIILSFSSSTTQSLAIAPVKSFKSEIYLISSTVNFISGMVYHPLTSTTEDSFTMSTILDVPGSIIAKLITVKGLPQTAPSSTLVPG